MKYVFKMRKPDFDIVMHDKKNHSEIILLRGETVFFGFHKGVLPSRLLGNVFSV